MSSPNLIASGDPRIVKKLDPEMIGTELKPSVKAAFVEKNLFFIRARFSNRKQVLRAGGKTVNGKVAVVGMLQITYTGDLASLTIEWPTFENIMDSLLDLMRGPENFYRPKGK